MHWKFPGVPPARVKHVSVLIYVIEILTRVFRGSFHPYVSLDTNPGVKVEDLRLLHSFNTRFESRKNRD